MNIVFICGTLEPGCDGTGDYVRRLAGSLALCGHRTGAIAWFDRYANGRVAEMQEAEGTLLPVLRLPAKLQRAERMKHAEQWLSVQDPAWLSLQYVPFSFHEKGFPFTLAADLKKLGRGRKWHLMFHEIWMGIECGATLLQRAKGRVQQQLICHLIHALDPPVIHTHCGIYRSLLDLAGIRAAILPLFSTIPVPGGQRMMERPEASLAFLHFGSIHPGSAASEFAKEIAQYGAAHQLLPSLLILGRGGRETERFKKAFGKEGIAVTVSGQQPLLVVASALVENVIGLSTSPAALWQKSSALAAMRTFGMPAIFIGRDWKARSPVSPAITAGDYPDGTIHYRPGKLHSCLSLKRMADHPVLSEVSLKFAASLAPHS